MGSYDVPRADRILCPFIEKRAIAKVRHYTSASGYLAEQVRTKLRVSGPVSVVPNGIDLEWFDHTPDTCVRERFGIPQDRPMIFFSGRMERRKGIHLCAEIASAVLEHHDASFVFAGQDLFEYMSGTVLPELEARGFGKSVYYLGKLGLDDVRSCLKESDIYFIPSLWENCPYSCLEAMAAGRAIVASDAGGLPELVKQGESGLIARSENPASFATGIKELLRNRELAAQLGRAARESVETSFNHLEIARRTLATYEAALSA
jgi:glycosyltransferase involved in cell wall biosynthesis